MGARGWPAWVGLWSAGAVGLIFALATPEALGLTPPLRREPDQVTATDRAIAAVPVLAGLLLPVLVALLGWRVPRLVRGCLLLCALGLGAAAVVSTGIPDVGPWQPWVTGGAAVLAVLGAVLGPGVRDEPSRVAGALASLGLMTMGAVVVLLAWQGLEYQGWLWSVGVTGPMWAALVGGVLLVLLGLVGRMLPERRWLAVPVAGVLLLAALVALAWAASWMLSVDLLDRHEESESGWSGLARLVVGTGLLAASAAVARRWWSTAAMSLVIGCLVGAGVVARDQDLWRLMW